MLPLLTLRLLLLLFVVLHDAVVVLQNYSNLSFVEFQLPQIFLGILNFRVDLVEFDESCFVVSLWDAFIWQVPLGWHAFGGLRLAHFLLLHVGLIIHEHGAAHSVSKRIKHCLALQLVVRETIISAVDYVGVARHGRSQRLLVDGFFQVLLDLHQVVQLRQLLLVQLTLVQLV